MFVEKNSSVEFLNFQASEDTVHCGSLSLTVDWGMRYSRLFVPLIQVICVTHFAERRRSIFSCFRSAVRFGYGGCEAIGVCRRRRRDHLQDAGADSQPAGLRGY